MPEPVPALAVAFLDELRVLLPNTIISRNPNRGPAYMPWSAKSSSLPEIARGTSASVADTSRCTAFVSINGSCDVRTFRICSGDPVIVEGIQTSGSIGARSPRFRTSPTTPTISNQAS